MISTTMVMRNKTFFKGARALAVLAFWGLVWQFIAQRVNQEVLVVSPIQVAARLSQLAGTSDFYAIIGLSVLRVLTGFFAAVLIGSILGILTAKLPLLDELVSPILSIIKATPVASFILLALVWLNKEAVPPFISFLMVLPILQGNVSAGCKNTPAELIEMSRLYRFSLLHKITKLYIPSVLPYFTAGFKTALGLAWKAGVAAEVLCFPRRAIGTELYHAKTYLETLDIFAWTVTIIVISVLIEKALLWGIQKISLRQPSSGRTQP